MIRAISLLCAILIMGALMGCKNTDSSGQDKTVTAADLMHHRYELVTFNNEAVPVAGDVAIEIAFGENMHVSGKACNRFNGNSSIENGVLKAPHLASTRMFCAEEKVNQLETALFGMLSTGAKVTIDGDKLILRDGDNRIIYTRRDLMQ